MIKRALVSVSDKTGIVEFARRLQKHSIEIISTGGTAAALKDAGIIAREVSAVTRFPEILGGRVKTLHPAIHGGILNIRDDEAHRRQAVEHGIENIDLVVVNLYPFQQTTSQQGVTLDAAIENIDIGGPAMIRSAAKNFHDVVVVVDPGMYAAVADELDSSGGSLSLGTRFELAKRAFEMTARYDLAVWSFLSGSVAQSPGDGSLGVHAEEGLPRIFSLAARRTLALRYGENPHQKAALYLTGDAGKGIARADKLQGKELSYNNLLDLDAAWSLVSEMDRPACVIIKHTNPCGAALGPTPREAFEKAREADPVSAFGGIIGFNCAVDGEAARAVAETFFEAIAAPGYESEALEILGGKKNLRVMEVGEAGIEPGDLDLRMISGGGLLVQERDSQTLDESLLRVVSKRQPTDAEMRSLRFAWVIAKHVKSNAIAYAREGQLVSVGAGQMSRVDSVRIGVMKAALPLKGCVLASDAFFPFRDGVDEAAKAGITAVIQPGGSVRDEEVIAAADEHDVAMVFTGMRHFKH